MLLIAILMRLRVGKQKTKNREGIKIENLKHFYGIPHCHTNYSTGKSSPLEALEYAKNKGLDFIIITDHNDYLEDKVYYKSNVLTKWETLRKYINYYNKKNKNFLALQGFEVHTNNHGHINIINSNFYFKGTLKKMQNLLFWFVANNESLGGFNHPDKSIINTQYSEDVNNYIKYVEVGNGMFPQKYKRYDKLYFELLDKGWKLGAINSQDNHKLNYGDSENLTVVLCDELNKKSILEAFKLLRVYSTESKSLKLTFSINNHIMGSSIPYDEKTELNFTIIAEDKINKIDKIEIITNGNTIIKSLKDMHQERIRYIFKFPINKSEKYYVIKVYMKDKIALTSPIFID